MFGDSKNYIKDKKNYNMNFKKGVNWCQYKGKADI